MKFRTPLLLPQYPFKISYQDRLLFLGSCFSEHIANFFITNKFQAVTNPFGILFNPLSIALTLDVCTGTAHLNEDYYQYFNGQWISFAHHGRFSHPDKKQFDAGISHSIQSGQESLSKANYLFITFGTSFYYYHIAKQLIVANCHKIPANVFEKRRCTITQIVEAFRPFFAWVSAHNPQLKIIMTVSPVRHLGDGFHENQLSKAILHLAIEQLQQEMKQVYYFPSYEILNDDLRDYRFYADDLIHPSTQAIDYMKEIVTNCFFDKNTQQQLAMIQKEVKSENHRPIFS